MQRKHFPAQIPFYLGVMVSDISPLKIYSFGFFPLPLKWKFSWFVQNTKLIPKGKHSKVVISCVFQWLKGASRTERTLEFHQWGDGGGGLLRRFGESTERGGQGGQTHFACLGILIGADSAH